MAKTQLILNRYQPLGRAGAGGFATVQVAWDTRIERKVAIKCLPLNEAGPAAGQAGMQGASQATSQAAVAAAPLDAVVQESAADARVFGEATHLTGVLTAQEERAVSNIPGLVEARNAAKLQDQNIVGVYDFEIQGNNAYIIMEYVEGATLSQLLREHGGEFTLDAIAAVFRSVAHALQVAHRKNVLHLDIKPDNILVSKTGQVKVTDFGLSVLADAQGFGTTGGGTIGYMPLEQMREESLDARCDEWALASVTYEMLAGENPFKAPNLAAAQAAIENAELVLPSVCWDDLDPEADDVLFYALDPDRLERYSSVADFAEEMQPFLGDAKLGTQDLSDMVRGQVEPEEESEGAEEPRSRSPQVPLREQITPGMRTAAAHVVGAAGTALMVAAALTNIPQTAGLANPLFWGLLVVATIVGAFRPHIGALLGGVALAAMDIALGAPALGVVLVAGTGLWWWFVGRMPVNIALPDYALRRSAGADNPANAAHAAVLGGAVGVGALGPLVAGFCLPPLRAMATAALQVLWGFSLASFGSGSLFTWDAIGRIAAPGPLTQNALSMLQDPSFWVTAASWVVAAGVVAALRKRPTRGWAVWAAVAGGFVLVLCAILALFAQGSLGAGSLAGAQESPLFTLVNPQVLGSIFVATVLVMVFAFLVPDFKSERVGFEEAEEVAQ